MTFSARDAEAVEIRGAGGMGLNLWFMEIDVTDRSHQGIGIGITGRLFLEIGDNFRIQGGLIQGRFTEDDDSQIKRNYIFLAAEGVYRFLRRGYITAGLRMGADHLDMVETLEREADDIRRIRDVEPWSFVWHPFVTAAFLLAGRYHFELENGIAFTYTDSRVHISYVITVGVYFTMGGGR
jgi:hypothetical protein